MSLYHESVKSKSSQFPCNKICKSKSFQFDFPQDIAYGDIGHATELFKGCKESVGRVVLQICFLLLHELTIVILKNRILLVQEVIYILLAECVFVMQKNTYLSQITSHLLLFYNLVNNRLDKTLTRSGEDFNINYTN